MYSLANRLTTIRNGERASRPYIEIKCITNSQCNKYINILNQLRQEGIIRGYSIIPSKSKIINIIIFLKYDATGKSVLRIIKQVSTPGRRRYVSTNSLWQPQTSSGFYILSTPYGIITDLEARYYNVGGEILISVT